MKHSFSLLTAVFAVLAFLISCGGDDESEDSGLSGKTGSIYGVVTDKATGEMIKNAGVELLPVGLKTVTGSDGSFEFFDISAGHYNLLVTKTGYSDTKSSTITVEAGKTAKGDVQIEKLPAALKVLDDEGNEISELDFGAEVDDLSRSFNIFNDSPDSINWEITRTAEWIKSVSKESGELKAGNTLGIIVVIDRTLLPKGENLTQLHITSDNGNKQLTIKASNYACEDGYFYNGSKCVNPCEKDPCGEYGTCKSVSAKTYDCKCNNEYFFDGSKCESLSECEKNVETSDDDGSTGEHYEYECSCEDGFFWNGSSCMTPCNENPCDHGECTATSLTAYTCKCEDGFVYNGSTCIVPDFPECNTSNQTPCKDYETGLMWSAKSSAPSTYTDAVNFCTGWSEGGFNNWRVPTIDELRSLINGCSNTAVGGLCKASATNGCLSSKNCFTEETCLSCGTTTASIISKFGDSERFWSSSMDGDDGLKFWCVNFSKGSVFVYTNNSNANVRCVR